MYKIREAKVDDYSMIATINDDPNNIHLANEPPIEKKCFEEVITAIDRGIYIVEKSGVMAAFVMFTLNEKEQSIYIEKLSIDKSFQKKGLDEHLYHKVERLADARKMEQMVISLKGDNPDVHDFFERKGWKRAEQENKYYLILK